MIGPRLSRAPAVASASESPPPNSDDSSEDGLLPRCIQAAFASLQGPRKDEADFSVTATCVELYNESVTDLLGQDKNKQLQVSNRTKLEKNVDSFGWELMRLVKSNSNNASAADYLHLGSQGRT